MRKAHFIGIGGAGMSAIAKVLLERGVEVSGSDLKRSRAATVLQAMGAEVHVDGHDPSFVPQGATVVVSSAIPRDNPELLRAQQMRLEVLTRGEALAGVLEGVDPIVVAGTHGKTTTTSMIATVLRHANTDPTYLIGGGLNESGTNARHGTGPFAVAESDESDGSFLLLHPFIGVVTNIEMDHPDHWHSLEDLREAFERFVAACRGAVVLPADDAGLIAAASTRVVTFGAGGDVRATDVRSHAGGASFDLDVGTEARPVQLRVPGEHNVANAVAAAAACRVAGLGIDAITAGLSVYRGVERRFHLKGIAAGVTVIDDYAHHPTEVKATLSAARSVAAARVIAVFQPHRYSRLAALHDAFAASFGAADVLFVTDVFGAGESPVPGISGRLIAEGAAGGADGKPVFYVPHRNDLAEAVAGTLRAGDLVITMGAGDITTLGDELLARLRSR